MDRAVVEEGGGEEAPPVTGGDCRPDEEAVVVDLVAGAVHLTAGGELEQVDRDVEPDEDLRDQRAAAGEAPAAEALRDAGRALRLARMVRAPDPDGREVHALGADGSPTLRAGDHRLPVRVPVAVHRFGGG